MARIISSVSRPEDIANRGERLAFRALQGLPNHFLVFYSVPFLRQHRKDGNLVDGENDFVVLDQNLGTLLVLEVKQGQIASRLSGDRRVWFQNEHELDVSPWDQAKGNKYSLIEWLSSQYPCDAHHFPLSFGHAVLLPDVHSPVGFAMPDISPELVVTWSTPEECVAGVERCSASWHREALGAPAPDVIEKVRRLLMPEFVYGNTLRDRIGVERRDKPGNPVCHEHLLDFIGNRPRARIAGCAGSGKTALAVSKSRQIAAQGQSVLFLVYNNALCEYLRQHLADAPLISVKTFHDFCRERCGALWPNDPNADNDFWWDRVPDLLEKALTDHPVQYDAVIVDEAQDFRCQVWLALERLLTPTGWFYIFYDDAQNVFGGDLQFPMEDAPFLLRRNCRGTRAILAALAKRTGITLQPLAELPEGAPVREETADSPGQSRRMLGKILHDWIRKEGLTENQVVILGAHSLKNTSIGESGKAGSFTIVERGAPAPGVIPYYTYMAFKGCESDAVILLDVDPTDKRWDKQGLYTAMTRARHLLGVVGVAHTR